MAITKLLLHLDGADGATSTTDASDSNHTINFNGTAELDIAAKKWGTASLLLDGGSDSIDIDDSVDWDICGSNSDDWTIDFWVKHVDHVGDEFYIIQLENSNNRWIIYHRHGSGLQWLVISDTIPGTMITTGWCAGGETTDTDWHHIALCKVGSKYGLYYDGVQVGYVDDSDTDTFAGSLFFGNDGATGGYFNGQMDEIRIIHSNAFNASPNATPDDTITVPTRAHGLFPWRGRVIFIGDN